MSMTLTLWKAPVVCEADEARELLEPWYDREDDSALEPSEDIARVAQELLRRYPDDDETGPWSDFPFGQTDRLLDLSIRWGADDAVLDTITELARRHRLLIYDPQGPDVHLPDDPAGPEEAEPVGFMGWVRLAFVALGSVGLLALGWWLPVPVLNWLLILVGGFLTSVCLFLFYILLTAPSDPKA